MSSPQKAQANLISPGIDFLTVGGLSFIVFALLNIFQIKFNLTIVMAIYLSFFINNPHFLHSYQILYKNFSEKISSPSYSPGMRARYIWAGILVPALLIVYMGFCVLSQNSLLLSWSANAMYFLVGWHYAKQSYGMLIVLSVLKKVFYTDFEKKIFLWNSYIVWIFTWLFLNSNFEAFNFFDITVYFFTPPKSLIWGFGALSVATTLFCIFLFLRKFMQQGQFSINGITGYLTAYIWLFLRWADPMQYGLVPAFHSLQYLPFVWRYKYNEIRDQTPEIIPTDKIKTYSRFALFILAGMLLGILGFHTLPHILSSIIPYNQSLFGLTLFFFLFNIFINVHHYFIDNVLWRKDNPEIPKYLFGTPA